MDPEQNQESSAVYNSSNEYLETAVELDPNFSIDEYLIDSIWDADEATNTSTTIPNCPTIRVPEEDALQWQVSAASHPRLQRTNYSVTTQQPSFDGVTLSEFHGLAGCEGNQSHDNVQSLHQLISTDFQLRPERPAGLGTHTIMVEQPMVNPVMQNGGSRGLDENVKKRKRKKKVAADEEKLRRRMIKHREAAERSRARKAAHVAELEVEVDQLKKENARLQVKNGSLMKQMTVDTMDQRAREKAINGQNRLRRCFSCPT